MKKIIFLGLILTGSVFQTYSQDIFQSQVPSLVLNSFQQKFPKASDIEWEMKGNQYKAEFETGFFKDHEVWFDEKGEMVKHKEEVSKSDLPDAIQEAIKANFSKYRVDDIEKVTEKESVIYRIEMKTLTEEVGLVFDENGKVLKQWLD